jgi:hypothetical protein
MLFPHAQRQWISCRSARLTAQGDVIAEWWQEMVPRFFRSGDTG